MYSPDFAVLLITCR